ncbi:putative lipoprotein [Spiroplasma kunkelii CR2-3x]|uniref:Putative lipoprotein n=1 Tax=Spiroplasma kunkelii CR2-3x TaxID=273035 RepID=A0A0K2JGR3_SPIKU|nr:lipoprotein [Spiroplasma kunkelii]ALA97633.1 putative lipoprotein [Spiroplasma kunkelii CR2-3x]
MKRLLSIIGAISLVVVSATNLVACDKNKTHKYTPEELTKLKAENKIDTTDENIKDNLEWIAPQEKPFNTVDNKWYYVIWKAKNNFLLSKFNNSREERKEEIIFYDKNDKPNFLLRLDNDINLLYVYETYQGKETKFHNWNNLNDYFKSVYRWNLDTQEPDLVLDNDGNIKVKDE